MRILHLFNWRLQDVKEHLEEISKQGFDAVQINPLQPLKEDNFDNWWLSYQPCGFSIGNQYGSKRDLEELCTLANIYNVDIYADVICTHMAGKNDGSLYPHERVDKRIVDNPYMWRERKYIYNWQDRNEIISFCAGLPSLNLYNYDLQDIITNFLNEMIDCGVKGFRFDSAKSIPTPQEGCDFWPRVISRLSDPTVYKYGEVIFADENLIGMYSNYIDVLTNTRSNQVNNVVAFTESHDTFYEFKYTKDITSRMITNDYEFLVRDYPNTIYFARPFDNEWKSESVRNFNFKEKNRNKVLSIN